MDFYGGGGEVVKLPWCSVHASRLTTRGGLKEAGASQAKQGKSKRGANPGRSSKGEGPCG